MKSLNVHPNVSPNSPARFRRLTHKQQIAVQTTTDTARHGLWIGPSSCAIPGLFHGYCRLVFILKTAEQ